MNRSANPGHGAGVRQGRGSVASWLKRAWRWLAGVAGTPLRAVRRRGGGDRSAEDRQ